jgi:hypothetical protein
MAEEHNACLGLPLLEFPEEVWKMADKAIEAPKNAHFLESI